MGATGCDDAPLIKIDVGHIVREITLVIPYYDNPVFLSEQCERWLAWGWPIHDRIDLIVVDDCSPGRPAAEVLRNYELPFRSVRCFRIEKDVRWNWLAARNIGAHYARPEHWLAITDIDHVLTAEAALTLTEGEFDRETIYRFSRRERDGEMIHPHPNSWFYTREMFWKVGGYDERMSGYYGSDGYYRRRCAATAPIRIMENAVLERWEHVGDSSTIRYKRKQPEDAALRPLARSLKGPPRVLSFPYHEEKLC
jgi:glycosyltransferase involved in cell wall biosynthesis